jgi:hypothetical protein
VIPDESIENFADFFRDQLALTVSLEGDRRIHAGASRPATKVAIHKKVLYSAILDALAGVRYRDESLGNHDRFVRLLREHASWPGGALVSAPVLRERLITRSPLRDHLDLQLAKQSTMSPNALTVSAFDEPVAELTALADTSELRHVNASEHYELLYKYRNFTVHEFREPGYAMETFASGGAEPLYHGYIGETKWRLLYPVGFFHKRVAEAIESLVTWFTANGVDPYDRVRTSADWYDR